MCRSASAFRTDAALVGCAKIWESCRRSTHQVCNHPKFFQDFIRQDVSFVDQKQQAIWTLRRRFLNLLSEMCPGPQRGRNCEIMADRGAE